MPSFTLIIPTMGRTDELHELFASLTLQPEASFDCLVVDQNTDERLAPILALWSTKFPIRRLRCLPGVSHARNIGLLHATGDIIAFPDDDCWYSPDLLTNVSAWFDQHQDYGILTVGAQDRQGIPSGNRWLQTRCEIHPINAFRTTFCSSIFVRRSVANIRVRFDETMGPGSGAGWLCGEETDYILNLRNQGAKAFFDRRWHIGHPKRDMLSGSITAARASGYGRGMGRVLQKHALLFLAAAFVLYDLLRVLIVLCRGDRKSASLCLHHAAGIVAGYMPPPAPAAVPAR